jgi:hypothetical protein
VKKRKPLSASSLLKPDGLQGGVTAGRKRIIITEGEVDALSVEQALGGRRPVVSLPGGMGSVGKAPAENVEWRVRLEKVVLALDPEEPCRAAADKAVGLFPCRPDAVISLPNAKDASGMLKAARTAEALTSVAKETVSTPDGPVRAAGLEAAFAQYTAPSSRFHQFHGRTPSVSDELPQTWRW